MKKNGIYMLLLFVILMGMTGCSSNKDLENKGDEAKALNEDDFNIEYKSLAINDKVDVSEITDEIGFKKMIIQTDDDSRMITGIALWYMESE